MTVGSVAGYFSLSDNGWKLVPKPTEVFTDHWWVNGELQMHGVCCFLNSPDLLQQLFPQTEEAGVGWVSAEVERSISSTQPSSSWNNPHVKGASFSSLNHHWLHPPPTLCVLKLWPDTWNQLSEDNNDKRCPVQLTYRSLRSRTGMSPTAPESWTTTSCSTHWKNMVTRVTSAVNTNHWVSTF